MQIFLPKKTTIGQRTFSSTRAKMLFGTPVQCMPCPESTKPFATAAEKNSRDNAAKFMLPAYHEMSESWSKQEEGERSQAMFFGNIFFSEVGWLQKNNRANTYQTCNSPVGLKHNSHGMPVFLCMPADIRQHVFAKNE